MSTPAHPEAAPADGAPLLGDAPDASAQGEGAGVAGSEVPGGRRRVPRWVAVVALIALLSLAVWSGFAVRDVLRARREASMGTDAAIQRARDRANAAPHDVPVRLDLAYLYLRSAEPTQALSVYEAVLRDSPDDVAALYGQGTALFALHRPTEAVEVMWHVLGREPGHVAAASALGDHYASVSQYRSLIAAVRPVVLVHADDAHLQYLMGLAYEHLGHRDWALARYRLALQADPGIPEAVAGLKRLSAKP